MTLVTHNWMIIQKLNHLQLIVVFMWVLMTVVNRLTCTQWWVLSCLYFDQLLKSTFSSFSDWVGILTYLDDDPCTLLAGKYQILEGKLPNTYALANVESHEGPQALRIRMHLEKEVGQEGEKISKAAGQVLTSLASSAKAAWWILKVNNNSFSKCFCGVCGLKET